MLALLSLALWKVSYLIMHSYLLEVITRVGQMKLLEARKLSSLLYRNGSFLDALNAQLCPLLINFD